MKNNKINIKSIIIILLICINISFLMIMLNMKNKNITSQEITKEQLGETITDNAYISMSTHTSAMAAKQQEINNMQNTAGQATATADKILKDYTAYKNGQLITGTMANNGAVTQSLAVGGTYTIPAGYHNGSGKVTNAVTNKGTLTLGTTNGTAVDITDGYYTHVNTTAVYNAGKSIVNSLTEQSATGVIGWSASGYTRVLTYNFPNKIVGIKSVTKDDGGWVYISTINITGNNEITLTSTSGHADATSNVTVVALGY